MRVALSAHTIVSMARKRSSFWAVPLLTPHSQDLCMRELLNETLKVTPQMRGCGVACEKFQSSDPRPVALKRMEGVHSIRELRQRVEDWEASSGR